MTKHTPGPWHTDSDMHTAVNSSEPKKHIAMVNFYNAHEHRMTEEEHQANAHLIASAPDLLKALIELTTVFEELLGETFDQADKAIAKAHGEEAT